LSIKKNKHQEVYAMKQGITVQDLLDQVSQNADYKRDFKCPTNALTILPDGNALLDVNDGEIEFRVSAHAHRQIGTNLKIPAAYYDRARLQELELFADTVNTWLHRDDAKAIRTVRTLGSNMRAYLSDRYQIIDNEHILNAVLPVLDEMGLQESIASCYLDDDKLYLKVINPKVQGEVRVNDIVQSGFVLSNSETGMGAATIQPLLYRLVCTNGMIIPEYGKRKNHISSRNNLNIDEAYELYSDETLKRADELFLMKIKDLVRAACSETIFNKVLERLQASTNDRVESPKKAIEMLAKTIELTEQESDGVLNHFILSGDFSRFGMVQAVTRYAQDPDDYHQAHRLELLGSTVLNLPAHSWGKIAVAA
jgi:hypothetical protein